MLGLGSLLPFRALSSSQGLNRLNSCQTPLEHMSFKNKVSSDSLVSCLFKNYTHHCKLLQVSLTPCRGQPSSSAQSWVSSSSSRQENDCFLNIHLSVSVLEPTLHPTWSSFRWVPQQTSSMWSSSHQVTIWHTASPGVRFSMKRDSYTGSFVQKPIQLSSFWEMPFRGGSLGLTGSALPTLLRSLGSNLLWPALAVPALSGQKATTSFSLLLVPDLRVFCAFCILVS